MSSGGSSGSYGTNHDTNPRVEPDAQPQVIKKMVEPMGFEPTNLTVSPDDSIGLSSPNPRKMASGTLVLDRNWTEIPEKGESCTNALVECSF
jgi:hypothetical protein